MSGLYLTLPILLVLVFALLAFALCRAAEAGDRQPSRNEPDDYLFHDDHPEVGRWTWSADVGWWEQTS